MPRSPLKARLAAREMLAGTFMKTASVDILEVLILSGLDFVCIDGEHAPFDRGGLSACLAVARAAGFPVLVRTGSAAPDAILAVLDVGATGIVVPHVTDAGQAAAIARSARFGAGGRGYAGSTRWAGYGTRSMAELLEQSATETVVIAQIEDPEAVPEAGAIAATDGIDGLFLGPADLSVGYGETNQDSAALHQAMAAVGQAAQAAGKAYMTFVPDAERAAALKHHGFHVFFVASEHAWMLSGARAAIAGIRDL